MSYVIAAPGQVAAAAADLGDLGSTISSANSTAMGLASSVTPPGADEVSASVAAMFDAHAQAYQLLSAQAAAFHDQFVQLVNSGATQYALTEAANASPLQTADHGVVSTAVNQSGQALTHAQPVMNAATPAGSAAAAVPSATASLAGGTAPAAPVAPLTSAAVGTDAGANARLCPGGVRRGGGGYRAGRRTAGGQRPGGGAGGSGRGRAGDDAADACRHWHAGGGSGLGGLLPGHPAVFSDRGPRGRRSRGNSGGGRARGALELRGAMTRGPYAATARRPRVTLVADGPGR